MRAPSNDRFERHEATWACKAFGRDDVNPRLAHREAIDAGAFLARLWALFGPADACDGGFSYEIRDRETGLTFAAYSGPSGPSYGGPIMGADALLPVLEAFERLLDETEPVECEITYAADEEYGGGERALGFRDGASFDRAVREPKRG